MKRLFSFNFSGPRRKSTNCLVLCAFLPLVTSFVGCVAAPPAPDMPLTARAEARSSEFWGRVIANQHTEAYAYLTPATKEVVTLPLFSQQMRALRVRSAKVEKSTCVEQTCTITLSFDVDIRVPRVGFKQVTLQQEEVWALSNGEIYLVRK
jgi:hypothetical protein